MIEAPVAEDGRPARGSAEDAFPVLVGEVEGEKGAFKGVAIKRQFVVLIFLIRGSWHYR